MTEKRRFKRIQILATVLIQLQNETLKVVAYNISQKGLRFVIPMDVRAGDHVTITLPVGESKEDIIINSKVVRFHKVKSSAQVCDCGIEFDNEISEDLLKQILINF